MKTIRYIKIKIGENDVFDAIAIRYLKAANWTSKKVFKSNELNSYRLNRAFYGTVRRKFKLPSQIVQYMFREVCAVYRTMQSLKQWNMATFNGPVLPITWMRDFHRNKTGSRILGELITLHHPNIPESGWKCSNIKRYGKVWYLLLCYEIEIPELKKTGGIVGVDIGLKRMMVATNSSNSKTLFFHGGKLNHLRTGIRKTRAQVQAVGTRSARRLLKRMSGHEAAVTEHLLHVASKALITYAVSNDCRKIVLEDLSNIRDASLNKGKDLRSKVQRWPYANLQFKITYKALAQGIETELVNPKNTSRGCARCGHVAPSNRKGLNFKCKKCGHRQDADRNASENIRLRSVSREHDSRLMGSYNPPKNSEPLEIRTKSPVSDADLVGV